jgi:hypothetical protein
MNSVIERVKKLPETCSSRGGDPKQTAEFERRLAELGRNVADKDKELEALRIQLAAVLPTISGIVRSRLQALAPSFADECESFRVDPATPSGFIVSGRLRNLTNAKAQVAAIARDFPAIRIDTSDLAELGSCGVTLAGGFVIETAGGSFREVQRAEARDKADRMPRSEDCERIGAAVDEARVTKTSLPPRFWVLRADPLAATPIFDLCERDEQGAWSSTDTQLSGRRALVIVKQN